MRRRTYRETPSAEELLERMEILGHELGISHRTLERLLRRRRRRVAIAGFPFNLLERALRSGLALLERAVAQLVRAVVR
jgi:hypothetical protein